MKKRNTRKKRVKKGGARSRYPNKVGFQAVYDMIIANGSQLSVLTTSSLKGFMVQLNVNEDYYAYTTDKDKPITSYILKFVIISGKVEKLVAYDNHTKETEKRDDFIKEAKLQQLIWQLSIENGKPEICPSVANLTICDNDSGKLLLGKLLALPNIKNTELERLFTYLQTSLSINRGLGILTMPNINNATTLNTLIRTKTNKQQLILESKKHLAAQVIMLFIELCVFNFDLHGGNTLIYKDANNQIQTLLIDFGRASDICNDNDDYLSTIEKKPIRIRQEQFYNHLKLYVRHDDPNDKIDFVKQLFAYLLYIDTENNKKHYKKETPQIGWIKEIMNNNTLCLDTLNLFYDMYFTQSNNGLTSEKIQKYTERNVFQNLENPDTYIQQNELGFSSASQNESYHSTPSSSQNIDFFDSQEGSVASSQEENQGIIASSQEENQGSVASSQSELSELIFIPSQPIQFNEGLAELPVTSSPSPRGIASFVSQKSIANPIADVSTTASASFNNSNYVSSTGSDTGTFSVPEKPNLSIEANNFNTESASKEKSIYHRVDRKAPYRKQRESLIGKNFGRFWGGKKRKFTYKVNKKRNKKRVTKKRYNSK